MGLTCEIMQPRGDEYSFAREELLAPFGLISVLKDNRLNKYVATKVLHMRTQQELEDYCRLATLAAEATSKLPTLLRINSHRQSHKPQCLLSAVEVEFDYVSRNFGDLLRDRALKLAAFAEANKRTLDLYALERVRLNDYAAINGLSQRERGYVNLHFLESEVLRLIDHVAGSVYYLRHFELEHGGLRPQNVLLDDEGKFLLVDRQLFQLETNYQQGLRGQPGRAYMSPQEFKSLKEGRPHPSRNSELSEIFSIGLMALEMAVLGQSVTALYDFDCWRASTFELNRLLAHMSARYSPGLTDVVQRMLRFDERDRLSLEQLIDLVTPLLKADVQNWEGVFEGSLSSGSRRDSRASDARKDPKAKAPTLNLLKRLSEIEAEYHRVMSSKLLNESNYIREESLRKDEQRIIERLKKISENGKWSEQNRESETWDASLVKSRQV